jgi:hypothetical protein
MADITSEDVQTWIMSKADDTDLKLLQDVISLKLRLQFRVGDKVWFDTKTRGIIHGVIVKMNAKSVKVQTDAGMQWTVGPNLLNKDTTKV